MLRSLLWLLGLFCVAVLLVLAARANQAYALVVWSPWRIQVSLNLLLILFVLGFLLLWKGAQLLRSAWELPRQVKAWRERQHFAAGQHALAEAQRFYFEGRYGQALKQAELAAEIGAKGRQKSQHLGLCALHAARAAQAMRNGEKRDHWLALAHEQARDTRIAATMLEAEFALAERRFDDAHHRLESLRAMGHRHIAVLRLSLQVEQARGRWDEVIRIARQLRKAQALRPEQAAPLISRAWVEQLQEAEGNLEQVQRIWQQIGSDERRDAGFLLRAVPCLVASGDLLLGPAAIEEALTQEWDSDLAVMYGRCRALDQRRQLATAEAWLVEHPDDAALLLCLARLCLRAQLWGKAQSYLEASLALQPTRAAHLEMARLCDTLERIEEAQRHYRAAAELGA